MAVFLGYLSAVELWRSGLPFSRQGASRAKPQPNSIPRFESLAAPGAEAAFAGEGLVHLVVADAASRGKAERIAYHVWNGPDRSFARVAPGVYASAPEACFLQLATVLPLVDLVLLGFELCGTYALDPKDPEGFRTRDRPLATVAALARFASKMEGAHGCKRARRALRYVMDGSASPMESVLAMLLCLPSSLGGYGLRRPRLNCEVVVDGAVGRARRIVRRCDLYWPEARLAVEYESDAHHLGSGDFARDSARRTELAREDVFVVTVAKGQVLDARKLDEVARALAKRLGQRRRCSRADQMARRYELRAALLAFPR